MKSKRRKSTVTNPLQALRDQGQAVWLDFLSRRFINEGGLRKLVEQDGLTGVTSNPSIFEKAIAHGADYNSSLKKAESQGDFDAMALYERLAIEDIQRAADVLRPAYEATQRADGYVSLEVSPYLAMNTKATIAEARRLWKAVDRDNVMIKVPATKPGLPAIRQLIGEGINVNITLLFSQQVYEEVAQAYLAGLEHLIARGGDPRKVASVASFFVSRIDVAVDKLIDEHLAQTNATDRRNALSGLRGKVAIANAKLAYQRYNRLFGGARWEKLRARGARVQRLLWASTGTKNPAYRDVLYVEELIAPDTVNTMPPQTMDAFRDHGRVRPSLEEGIEQAKKIMANLQKSGISIDSVTAKLVEEGVRLFADAFDKLLDALACKRRAFLDEALDSQRAKLSPALEDAIEPAHGSVAAPRSMQLGVIGLGRMGGNIVRRLARNGHRCVVFDQKPGAIKTLVGEGAIGAADLKQLVGQLEKPRAVWVMLPAGEITENAVIELGNLLEPGDIIIDGGNSFYKDDVRRAKALRPKGIRYVDCGTSGGVWGLERGYCLMIGGDKEVIEHLDPMFDALAPGAGDIPATPGRKRGDPRVERGYVHCGPSGAGHFVKMVHNGIEYGLMEAYAEGFNILRNADPEERPEDERYHLDLPDIAEVWRRGSVLGSWLLDLSAMALAEDPTLSRYSGFVADSGEGRWTIMTAIEEAVPANALSAALFARFRSREDHTFADKLLSAMRSKFGGHVEPKTES